MPGDMAQQNHRYSHGNGARRAEWMMSGIVPGLGGPADAPADRDTGSTSELYGLMQAIKANNRDAFVTLYDLTVSRVFGLAMRITRQHELAEEVVSDVYMQVWQHADTYSAERGKVIAWLCILCRSRALDSLRRDNSAVRRASVGLEVMREPEDPMEPPDLLLSLERGSAIHAAVGRLSRQQRQLVALAYFRGYSHSELAAFMNMPIGTVKTHLYRAIGKLREMMSEGATTDGLSDE